MDYPEIMNVQLAARFLASKHHRPVEKMQEHIRQLRRSGKLVAINEGENTRAFLFRREALDAIELGVERTRGVRRPRNWRKREAGG